MKKIVFMGTPIFAAEILDFLIMKGYNISLVVSQPDKKVGRKQLITETPVKKIAKENKIDVFQPEKLKEDYQKIIEINPDLIITAAYGQIVPDEVLNCVSIDAINIHGSLLPKYRGGAPIHYAVMNGDKKTGVTLMKMVSKMDAGDIIFQKKFNIGENDTTEKVHDKMICVAKELLDDKLDLILNDNYEYIKQDENLVTYSPNISKDDEKIDWSKNSLEIHNKIRGLNSWPVAYTILDDKRIKIYKSIKTNDISKGYPGEIIGFTDDSILVNTKDKVLKITEIQIAGKIKMSVKDFKKGINIKDYNGKTFES